MTPDVHRKNKVLILGIGNVLMGDEGIGVRVVNALEEAALPQGVECLDGGTGSFLLLEPMQNAEKVILIDATIDGKPAGTIRRLRPKYSADYPPTLTAHDIGLKDMTMDMSPELEEIIPLATELVSAEARAATGH